MKNIIIALLLTLILCGTIAAQEEQRPFTVTVEAAADPLFIRSFFGDYATYEPELTGKMEGPFFYQGGGITKSFQSSGFADGIIGRAGFAYNGEKLSGGIQMRGKNDAGYTSEKWTWNLGIKLFDGHLRVAAGNNSQRGQMETYGNFDGFLKGSIGTLGVVFPMWRITGIPDRLVNNMDIKLTFPYFNGKAEASLGFAEFSSSDANDLFVPAGDNTQQALGVLVAGNFEPVTVSAALGGLFTEESTPFKSLFKSGGDDFRLSDFDRKPSVVSGMSMGVRAEGAKIADLLTLAATYKFASSAYTKKDSDVDKSQLFDEQRQNHSFGFYVNVKPYETFGATVGYSGQIQKWENSLNYGNAFGQILKAEDGQEYADHYYSKYREAIFPFYNGIDLRLNYTGIEQLNITFNNNVSFATVKGNSQRQENPAYEWANSWAYSLLLNDDVGGKEADRSESYLGVFNSLGANYELNDTMTFMLQAANQLGTFTLNWENDSLVTISDHLGIYAGMKYTIFDTSTVKATIRTGFAMYLHSFQYEEAEVGVHKAGWIDYGMPLSLSLTF